MGERGEEKANRNIQEFKNLIKSFKSRHITFF
jgi:hypothetical protein